MELDCRGCIMPSFISLPMELNGTTIQFRNGLVIVRGTIKEVTREGAFDLKLEIDDALWRLPFSRRWYNSKMKEVVVYDFEVLRNEEGAIDELFDTAFFIGHKLVA